MRRFLLLVLVFASGGVVGWMVRSRDTTAPATTRPGQFQSFTVQYPDPHAPDGRANRTLIVAEVGTDQRPAEMRSIKLDDWCLTLWRDPVPGGTNKGAVTYYARPPE